ncbi:MAG: dNTP triphosphohydrolase [Phycisphaerae bacterium]|nr:dNTP triphosphohydrolase [Phycisphaerae bacterium]
MTDPAHAQLAPYAVTEADAGGRRHGEPEHPYRTCFQRDRDRVLHATAFRRLDYKTQVFVPHVHDHFRTRLTHTLEVAQIARDLARPLRLNEDLVEAVALAHDVGHPPFGHAGEQALAAAMDAEGGFEHNRQSLRVVEHLEHPYPGFRGLNLTNVVRECLARHQTPYDRPAAGECAVLEGQLVDKADEIAYTAADLEDALVAVWVTRDDVADLALWRRAWARAERDHAGARDIHKRIRAVKNVVAILADDLLATTRETVARLGIDAPAAARAAGERAVVFSGPVADAARQMQQFLLERVYHDPRAAAEDERGRRIITELFAAYVADPSQLPDRYRRRIGDEGLRRIACDYVAGMTDRFCERTHERIVR